MKTLTALTALALLSTACGTAEQGEAVKMATREEVVIPETVESKKDLSPSLKTEAAWSLKAASPDKLPECDVDGEGRLAWVVSEKTAFACSEGEWLALDLRGDKGSDGADGQSIVGAKGDKGERGEKGETGAQGVTGISGDTGQAGQDGVDGITTTVTEVRRMEHLPKARDAQGVEIGDVIYFDTARSHFIVVTPVGVRLRFTSLGGVPTWNIYYKTADCSGTGYVVAEAHFFETAFQTQHGLMLKNGAASTHTAAYRKRDGIPCEVAPSVVTANMFALRAPTVTEQADLWNFGAVFVD